MCSLNVSLFQQFLGPFAVVADNIDREHAADVAIVVEVGTAGSAFVVDVLAFGDQLLGLCPFTGTDHFAIAMEMARSASVILARSAEPAFSMASAIMKVTS